MLGTREESSPGGRASQVRLRLEATGISQSSEDHLKQEAGPRPAWGCAT